MNRRTCLSQSRRAFTLIEMVVILGIISVLAAILFPVLASGKSATKRGSDFEKMARLSQASMLYAIDANETFVAAGVPAQNFAWSPAVNATVDAAGNPWMGWGLRLAPYEANFESFLSPSEPGVATFAGECSNSGQMALTNGYAVNWMLSGDGTYGNAANLQDAYAWSPDGTVLFDQPSALAQIVDSAHTIAFTPSNAASPAKASTGCLMSTLQASDFSNIVEPYAFATDTATLAFADGHAAKVSDGRLTARYQGLSGPWQVYHLRSKKFWMEPTMPNTNLGFQNQDVNGRALGDL
jgi:type II secretory pathway pseudopilin PulG